MLREWAVWEDCLLSSLKAHGDQGEVSDNSKTGQEDYPGYHRPVSLISGPGKIMEQDVLEHISGHTNNKVTGSSQQRYTKGEACLTYLILCYYKMLRFVDDGEQ